VTRSCRTPFALLAVIVLLLGTIVATGARPTPALAAADVATCAPGSGSATIGGVVTAAGGAPLSGVSVTAYTDYGRRVTSATTNASGVYQIGGLIGGSYLIEFTPFSGASTGEWYPDATGPLAAAPVAVPEGGAVTGIDAQLADGARFSGNVVGQGGGPLQSVSVSVYDASGQRVASASTDAAGNYTTRPGLPSGSYRIGFEGVMGFLDGYYSGAASLDEATPLAVVAPELRTAIDATLSPGGSITGTITSAATGLPLGGIWVSASGEGGSDSDFTAVDGAFTLSGLGSGSYELEASPSSETVNLVPGSRTVEVVAPNTTPSADIALAQGATLSGAVTGPGGTPLSGITVYVGGDEHNYQRYTSTNAAGLYSFTGMPSDRYRVLFRPSSYIPEAYDDQPDFALAQRITLVAPESLSGIDAELAPGARVSGTVTEAGSGLPIKDIFVEVLDLDGQRVETAFTQADGTYQTQPTLASGSYLVRFNADERFASCTYVTAYYGGQLRLEDAEPVTVSAPTPATGVDASLTRGSILFGRLTAAATGAPISSGQVTIYDEQGEFAVFARLTEIGGWATTSALPSGSYRVRFSDGDGGYIDEFYDDALTLETATPVVVSAPDDVTGLDAALAQGATISGRVAAGDTGQPFTAGYVVVYDASGNEVGYGNLEEDGSYVVRDGLPSGSYLVAAFPYSFEPDLAGAPLAQGGDGAAAGYSPSYYGGVVTPSAATAVELSAPALTSGIDIVMLQGLWLPQLRR
jgi:hypothetical protein